MRILVSTTTKAGMCSPKPAKREEPMLTLALRTSATRIKTLPRARIIVRVPRTFGLAVGNAKSGGGTPGQIEGSAPDANHVWKQNKKKYAGAGGNIESFTGKHSYKHRIPQSNPPVLGSNASWLSNHTSNVHVQCQSDTHQGWDENSRPSPASCFRGTP